VGYGLGLLPKLGKYLFIVAHHILGVDHVVVKVILFGTSKHKQYMDLALCPHAAKYILHKMGLAACWLAIYADDERWAEVFHCIYI